MPDLETLLREVRPAPDPAWATRLDTRVANRFARPPRLRFVRRNFWALSAAAVPVLLIVAIAFTMHSGSSDDSSSSSATSAKVPSSAQSSSSSAAPDVPLSLHEPATSPPQRDQLHSAELTISAPNADVEDLSDRAMQIVDGLGGYVTDSSVSTTSSHAEASITLAIPAAKLQQGLASLSKLGHVTRRTQQTTDVTDEKATLEAAVRDARADREGLRRRLARATTDKERAHLQALIQQAARRITRSERSVASLTRQVSYATVDLTIRGVKPKHAAVVPKSSSWTPGDALHDAGRVLEVSAGVLLIALAVAVPVGLVAGLIALAARITVRRRRERALEMA